MENRKLIYGGIAVAAVLLLVIVFWPASTPDRPEAVVIDEPAIERFVIPESIEPQSTIALLPELPALPIAPTLVTAPSNLDGSDMRAREAALDLSIQLGRWLVPTEQIRKWVVFVDRAAEGDLQSKHRPWSVNMGSYVVAGSEQQPLSSEQNYQRYNAVLAVIDAVAVDKLAYYISQWSVLFDEAYQELGHEGSFSERVLMALDQVIAAEPLAASTQALVRPSVMYKYADVRLESASDIQKLMWRMGPNNAAQLQRAARVLRNTLLSPPRYQSDF